MFGLLPYSAGVLRSARVVVKLTRKNCRRRQTRTLLVASNVSVSEATPVKHCLWHVERSNNHGKYASVQLHSRHRASRLSIMVGRWYKIKSKDVKTK